MARELAHPGWAAPGPGSVPAVRYLERPPEAQRARPSVAARLGGVALVALMAVGSVVLWIGVPVGFIYAVSQNVSSSQPSLGPYVLVLVGIPLAMVLVGRVLSALNRLHGRVTGTAPEVVVRAPWHRSMRDGRDVGHPRTILDVIMVVSVGLALLCMGVWFLFFAEGGGI